MPYSDELLKKIKTLSETIWDHRAQGPQINAWLDNFAAASTAGGDERTHALYLLSQFMYFGVRQTREMMRVLFRDLYQYPIVEEIRRANKDTTDSAFIEGEFRASLERTLFLGVGSPSESGYHLLYYFRQENELAKDLFVDSREVFRRKRPTKLQLLKALLFNRRDRYAGAVSLRYPNINRYVFIDDFCGSGHQGEAYSRDIVEDIRSLDPDIEVSYLVLFATTTGMDSLKNNTEFNIARCVFELDDTFKCFSRSSRYFPSPSREVSSTFAENMCRAYGRTLVPTDPVGYRDCQLLIGFQHNTPDNTLPIFWYDGPRSVNWKPIFKRYMKH